MRPDGLPRGLRLPEELLRGEGGGQAARRLAAGIRAELRQVGGRLAGRQLGGALGGLGLRPGPLSLLPPQLGGLGRRWGLKGRQSRGIVADGSLAAPSPARRQLLTARGLLLRQRRLLSSLAQRGRRCCTVGGVSRLSHRLHCRCLCCWLGSRLLGCRLRCRLRCNCLLLCLCRCSSCLPLGGVCWGSGRRHSCIHLHWGGHSHSSLCRGCRGRRRAVGQALASSHMCWLC